MVSGLFRLGLLGAVTDRCNAQMGGSVQVSELLVSFLGGFILIFMLALLVGTPSPKASSSRGRTEFRISH